MAQPDPSATGVHSVQRSPCRAAWWASQSRAARALGSLGSRVLRGAAQGSPPGASPAPSSSMPDRPVVTRIAPSPTGMMHIGTARTALFNYLYARRHGGKFLIRIEDTDRERSTEAAVKVIFEGMAWLGMTPDEAPVFQAARAERHREAALAMLEAGTA